MTKMFCGNCGLKLTYQANFCGNCGFKISPAQVESKGNLSKSIKNEISSLPLVTLIGDTVKGASGLSQLQDDLKENPKDPLLWLWYYEGFVTYKKMNQGVNVARIIYNPVGFAVSKGISTGLNALDDEYETFDPQKCLKMSLALSMKKIKDRTAEPIHSLIVGKTLFYMGINEGDIDLRDALYLKSIKYITFAIQAEKNDKQTAEYFFYLSQVYGIAGNTKLQFRCLNISRKMGFMPSLDLLKKQLKDRGMTDEEVNSLTLKDPRERIFQFSLTFKPDTANRIENSIKFAFTEQSKKFKSTSSRIKNLFSE
ncbi:zinc ribbon domain-containing protein [Fictibacillus sp. JL2B1089]|uniref:zinc ribbon domain-containing protein n=1 Tax=Fictibacillus sp. JL2B1089 TaxID=3399565 RepID=UPI003A883216